LDLESAIPARETGEAAVGREGDRQVVLQRPPDELPEAVVGDAVGVEPAREVEHAGLHGEAVVRERLPPEQLVDGDGIRVERAVEIGENAGVAGERFVLGVVAESRRPEPRRSSLVRAQDAVSW
jgi:hypothetical protein